MTRNTTDMAKAVLPLKDVHCLALRGDSARRVTSSFNCPAWIHLAFLGPMSHVVRFPYQAASQELIAKLVKAGYLQPALCNDADAITTAIAQLKEDLRGGGDDEGPRAA